MSYQCNELLLTYFYNTFDVDCYFSFRSEEGKEQSTNKVEFGNIFTSIYFDNLRIRYIQLYTVCV